MRKLTSFLYIWMAILCFACQTDEDTFGGTGYLSLNVGQDMSVETKAEEYDPRQIAVRILNADKAIVKQTDDFEANWKGQQIELNPGEYIIEAFSNNYDGNSAYGDKGAYYYGSTTATIKKGEPTSADITCTLANVKVTVAFDTQLVDGLSDGGSVNVQVSNASGSHTARDFSTENPENKVAYFPVTDLKVEITVKKNDGTPTNTMERTIAEVEARDHYILNIKLQETGEENISVVVDPSMNEFNYTITVPRKSSNQALLSTNPWSKFALLTASDVITTSDTDLTALKFQYRKKGETNWTDLATSKTESGYTAKATSLTVATTYEYQFTDGKDFTINGGEFTTENATALYNGSFDLWSDVSLSSKRVPYPLDPDESINYGTGGDKSPFSFWDSGNAGGALMDKFPTKKFEDNGKIGAELSSQYIGLGSLGKFAAGNIYTGHYYYTSMMPMGAQIFFGQPFTSRPIQLKGRFKYRRGGTVDQGVDPYKSELTSSGGDQCGLYIALTDNEGLDCDGKKYAFEINNLLNADEPENFRYKNSIDFSTNNKSIIAYGTITDEEAKGTGEWQEFTIDLKYHDLTRQPKYIIVVASASKYGDYFTGSTSSVMYIDDFELIYDGEPTMWE